MIVRQWTDRRIRQSDKNRFLMKSVYPTVLYLLFLVACWDRGSITFRTFTFGAFSAFRVFVRTLHDYGIGRVLWIIVFLIFFRGDRCYTRCATVDERDVCHETSEVFALTKLDGYIYYCTGAGIFDGVG